MTDRYRNHAHPAHQPGVGSLVLQVIGAGLLLAALGVAFVYVWSMA